MIDITILHWRISPYFICFLLSFVLAYLYVTWYLKKAGVKGSHIFYSELLNTVLALYFEHFISHTATDSLELYHSFFVLPSCEATKTPAEIRLSLPAGPEKGIPPLLHYQDS